MKKLDELAHLLANSVLPKASRHWSEPDVVISSPPQPEHLSPMVSIEIYDPGTVGGAGGLPSMTFRWCMDGKSYTLNPTTTATTGANALGSTGLSVTFPQAYYIGSRYFNSPLLGTGFSSIVGSTIQDGTVTWMVIDGGCGLLFENVGQFQVERCQALGFGCGIVLDGIEVVQVRDCQIGNINGIWVVANNERNSAAFASTAVAAMSNGVALPTGTIYVSSTAGFASSGQIQIQVAAYKEPIVVQYTGIETSPYQAFTGCTGGLGTLAGGNVVQCGVPQIGGETNTIQVKGCQIWHSGIGIADSGGDNHNYRECNFEGTPFSAWARVSAASDGQTLPQSTTNVDNTADFPNPTARHVC
jgi:hypothetical protein